MTLSFLQGMLAGYCINLPPCFQNQGAVHDEEAEVERPNAHAAPRGRVFRQLHVHLHVSRGENEHVTTFCHVNYFLYLCIYVDCI